MTVVNDYSKLAFTGHVDRTVTAYSAPAIVPIKAGGTAVPVFCVHPIEGVTSCYTELADRLSDERPVYGVQASAIDSRPASLTALAARYAEDIRGVAGSGPVHLLGLSFGGLLAHAIAVELQRLGSAVDSLTLLGSDPLRHEGESQHDMLTRMGDDVDRSRAEELLTLASHHDALAVDHFPGVYVGTAFVVSSVDADTGPAWHAFVSGDVLKYTVPDVTDFAIIGDLVDLLV